MNDKKIGISRDSDEPLYKQVSDSLEQRVQSGELRHGETLPSELALMKQYKVSRITIRQALAILEQRGLIYRRQGKGTFVRAPQLNQTLNRQAKTIVEALREHGVEPEVRVLGMQQIPAPRGVSEILGTGDEPVTRLRRIYLTQGVPIALVDLFLPLAMSGVAQVLCREDHLKETSYSVFENELHIKISKAKHVIHSTALEPSAAEALGMPTGAACLAMDRITHAEGGGVLELMKFYYPADSFQFEITLPRHVEQIGFRISSNWRSERPLVSPPLASKSRIHGSQDQGQGGDHHRRQRRRRRSSGA